MIHFAYTSAQTKRATPAANLRRALVVLLVLALALGLTGCGLFKDRTLTSLTIDDATKIDTKDLLKYEDLQQLDVRNAVITVEDYLALQSALPNCDILWSVPIGSQRFDNQLTEIALPAETDAASLDLIKYFPNLASVDARACTCYDALLSKSIELSGVTFVWQVEIGGVTLLNTDTTLDLSGQTLDGEALLTTLSYVPGLTNVNITNTNLTDEEGTALEARYPNISFLRTMDLFGTQVSTDATELDLTQATITDDTQLVDKLAPLKKLTTCDLTGQTISFETMAALEERYPLIAFSFTFELFGQTLTPEMTELSLQGQTFTTPEEVSEGLKHLPNLTKCDMCGTGLTSEQMVQLQGEFPAVAFVWYVQIGAWQVRTDIEAFSTENRKTFPDGAGTYIASAGNSQLVDTDLAAFQYCTNLVYLDLDGNKITDLSFLKNLPKLRFLSVGNNKITDISAISSLSDLEFLEIFINYISDLNPLVSLTKLTSLNCSRIALTDTTPLTNMKQLKKLWIMNNKLDKDTLAKLAEALPDCTINSHGTKATAGGWREEDLYYEFAVKAGLIEPTPAPETTPEPSITPDPAATLDPAATPAPTVTPAG